MVLAIKVSWCFDCIVFCSLVISGSVGVSTAFAQWAEPALVTAEPPQNYDNLGSDVDIDGEYLIAGLPGRVPGGAALIFHHDGNSWEQLVELRSDDAAEGDKFGASVAISGNLAAVGAYRHDAGAVNTGSVYTYRYLNGSWNFISKLTPPGLEAEAEFGFSLAISDNVLIVGAPRQNDWAGAARVYRFDGAEWSLEQTILAPPAAANFFSHAVAVLDDLVAVGNPSGSLVFLYRYNGTEWSNEHMLSASDASSNNFFGGALALAGDCVLVGAPGQATDINYTGAAYVFQFAEGAWVESKLSASNAQSFAQFGSAVTIANDIIAIGAPAHNAQFRTDRGAAYIYRFDGATWLEEVSYEDNNGDAYAQLGFSVAMSNAHVVAAAPYDNLVQFKDGVLRVFEIEQGGMEECSEDVNADGMIDFADIFAVLAAWGPCADCPEDTDSSGAVDFADVLAIIVAWGPCQ